MNTNIKIFILIIVLLVLGTIASVFLQSGSIPLGPGKYDAFATCLKDKGAVFYGAFWCTHCQATKKEFGSSAKLLPYVECSTADALGQTQTCKDKKILGYPTWEFTNSFSLESITPPHKCSGPEESKACEANYLPDRDAWVVGSLVVSSVGELTQEGTKWTFPALSRVFGEVSLKDLSQISSCVLPE